jgi:hypothetical protein
VFSGISILFLQEGREWRSSGGNIDMTAFAQILRGQAPVI